MSRSQAKSEIRRIGRQSSTPKNQGKCPQGIKKQRPQRSIRKSARSKWTLHQREESKDKDIEPKHPFPSPSTSNTPSKEVPQSSPVLSKAVNPSKWARKSSPNPRSEEAEQSSSLNRLKSTENLDRKRKRSPDPEDLTLQIQDKPIEKRARISPPDYAARSKKEAGDINENDLPIEYWRKTGNWPKKFFEPDPNMSQELTKKRSSSTMSYSQGVKEGEYPQAYTPDYEKKVLAPAGIIMDQQTGEAAISNEDKKLCITLVQAHYEPPKNSLFADDVFMDVMNSIRSENEPRVVRDIGPYITPSAEHLRLRGAPKVKHLKEIIQAEWTQCVSLADPRLRPDFTVGFSSSAFSSNEMKKLEYYRASQNPTEFAGNLYFPFLTCEVKCGASGLNFADRQNIRNASTAVYAILQLYRGGDESRQDPGSVSRADQLHRKVLVFSISHDHTQVNIYGHYALIGRDRTTFHRYMIRSFNLLDSNGKDRWTAYNFVRKLYDDFALTHLKRIQDAVSLLPEKSESFMSVTSTEAESELPDSQETASAPALQNNEAFIKPALPPKKKRQTKDSEIAGLKAQNDLLLKQQASNAREREESKQRHEEVMEQNRKLMEMLAQRLS